MVREEKNLTGNARYEGFCIDLLKWIAGQVGFQYSIELVPDHMYGVYDPETREWNGIVRELMDKVRAAKYSATSEPGTRIKIILRSGTSRSVPSLKGDSIGRERDIPLHLGRGLPIAAIWSN